MRSRGAMADAARDRCKWTPRRTAIETWATNRCCWRAPVRLGWRNPRRRAHARRPLAVPVAVVPLDAHFFPVGRPFMGRTHNLSSSGIALVHTRSTTAPHLALDLTLEQDREIRAVMRVARCRAIGLFYEIAGPFLVRIAPPPQRS